MAPNFWRLLFYVTGESYLPSLAVEYDVSVGEINSNKLLAPFKGKGIASDRWWLVK